MAKKRAKPKQQSKPILPILLLVGGAFLVIIAIVLLTQNGAVNDAILTQDDIPRLTALEAQAAVENENALLVDVRSESSFASLHAENAINIPLEELPARVGELDPQRWIITYCT